MRFIAFDLETTGTVPGVDQIVEIGAIRFVNGLPDAIFATLINPGVPMPEAASAVNGITDAMLVGKPKVTEVLQPFAEFCGDDILVAHNAPFDTQFLIADYKRHEITCPNGVVLDTCAMARKVLPGLANYKLGTLVQHLSIDSAGFHRAEADASYCGQLFIKMLNRISTGGVMPPIANLVALTGKPEQRFPVIEKKPKQLGFLDSLL
ncbi:MAG: 3'-5' exonuclease [Bdellovibrionaceae bacterium]|nr:3'-5' exonuclease [Pseudobdellovibrionaceae bacterium]